ncbi:hypothetical protein MGG_16745 [Pyricularia oryzae 70-15]|uniref:Uncharacterized protein n=2 Tax=Pyricularia oryzae TaxID=318829 RepID=G4N4X2_PYRO7|nr:uncharacterized protein MGG_16745 [Pyricularia oryzae 70-15]EHA52084.1 hypothetical protein MGG_16745 [Pyricularia oryzae 70-15]KAI7928422.1 hypothetical protein M9X92_001808 [Pyricularia oryzae]QBZ58755.1 hypothetical protein PoMZ_03713 [Pyricularia oryzae]
MSAVEDQGRYRGGLYQLTGLVPFVGSCVVLGVGVVPESEKLDLGYVSVDPCTRRLPTDFTA